MAFNEIAEKKALNALNNNALEDTLTVLMKAYGDDIFRFCKSMLNNSADAQDVLQQVFVHAFEGLSTFHGDSRFRTWLYAIARNRCLDLIKKNHRLHQRLEFVDQTPEQVIEGHDSAEYAKDHLSDGILQRCLNKLSSSVRMAILLRFQSELSYEEASDIVQEKAGTLQARVTRALPLLRQCVEENGVAL